MASASTICLTRAAVCPIVILTPEAESRALFAFDGDWESVELSRILGWDRFWKMIFNYIWYIRNFNKRLPLTSGPSDGLRKLTTCPHCPPDHRSGLINNVAWIYHKLAVQSLKLSWLIEQFICLLPKSPKCLITTKIIFLPAGAA